MRIVALLVLAACALAAAIIYLPALVARDVAGAMVAVERWACGRIMWAVGWLQR